MKVTLKKGDGSRHGDNLKPGEWGITEDGHIMVRCPHESHADGLPRFGVIRYAGLPNPKNWTIDKDGNVSPSIFFTSSYCGWHVFAKLEGWTG